MTTWHEIKNYFTSRALNYQLGNQSEFTEGIAEGGRHINKKENAHRQNKEIKPAKPGSSQTLSHERALLLTEFYRSEEAKTCIGPGATGPGIQVFP